MCPANRNRPDYRSIAFCIVIALIAIALFAFPASANSAEYFVSENGTSLSAHVTMVGQSEFYLVKPGFFGTDEALTVNNLSLKDADGNDIAYKQSGYTLKFDEGNYTLGYDYKITDNLIYAKYPQTYNVTVFIPNKFATGHLILGTVSKGGIITDLESSHAVSFEDTKAMSVTFYDANRPFILYAFLGIWAVVLLIVLVRHFTIKKRVKKIGE